MKNCKDCGISISPLANHTGHNFWCEDCFEKGLTSNMSNHFQHFARKEMIKERKIQERYRRFEAMKKHLAEGWSWTASCGKACFPAGTAYEYCLKYPEWKALKDAFSAERKKSNDFKRRAFA